MGIKNIRRIIEKYFTTITVDDIIGNEDVDIYENPSLKELMKEIDATGKNPGFVPMKGVRFLITKDLNTFVWGWDRATHGSVRNILRLGSDVIGGVAILVSPSGDKQKEVAFDLGTRSVNKGNGYSQKEMAAKFFSTRLAKTLGMDEDNTEVKFFSYNL